MSIRQMSETLFAPKPIIAPCETWPVLSEVEGSLASCRYQEL